MISRTVALNEYAIDIDRSARALGEALYAVRVPAPPQVARAVQAEQNLYERIAAEFGLHKAAEVGRLMGSHSKAPRNRAIEARKAGRLLGLQRGAITLYPGFQLDADGQPLPVIAELRALAAEIGRSETGVIQWLCGSTTYFGGQRPVDHLRSDPDRVLDVARRAWTVEW